MALTPLESVLLATLISISIIFISGLAKKVFGLQAKMKNGPDLGNPGKSNLHSLIIIAFLSTLVIFILWISVLIWRLSLEIGSLHLLSIILYVVIVITFGSLTYIFYENVRSGVLLVRPWLLSLRAALLCWALTFLAYVTAVYVFRDGGYSFLGLSFGYHIVLAILAALALPQVLSPGRFRHIKVVMGKTVASMGPIGVVWIIYLPTAFVIYFLGTPIGLVTTLEISFPTFLYILLLVIIAPCAEELFFRGYLQTSLQKTLLGVLGGLIVASILYAVVHLPRILFAGEYAFSSISIINLPSIIGPMVQPIIGLFALGAILGYTYQQTKSLVYPIILHSCWNITIFAAMLLRT